jgi:hypothetical protein
MLRFLGYIADKLMNAYAPAVTQRSFEAINTESWLADVEADHDSWQPDELWAAHFRLTDPASPLAGVSVTPAAAEPTSAVTAGGGGHLPIHDELIEELVQEYRAKLYDWFRP